MNLNFGLIFFLTNVFFA